jgi:hypothetical protein
MADENDENDDTEKESDWSHTKGEEGQIVHTMSTYLQGFKIGENMTNHQQGIMFFVTRYEGAPGPENPIMQLPVVCADEEGWLLLYNGLGRVLGLKGN